MAAVMMARPTGEARAAQMNSGADALTAAIKEVFQMMHPDPVTNEVGRDDIGKGFLEVVQHQLSDSEIDALMKEVDTDASGFIDYDEFAAWMMSSSKLATELRHKVDTAACGTLDTLISDSEIASSDREPDGPKPMVWNSPDSGMQTIWVMLEEPNTSTAATIVGLYVQSLILIGSAIFVAETLETVKVDSGILAAFHVIEWFCVAQFTVEYFLRVFVSPWRPDDCKPELPKEQLEGLSDEEAEALKESHFSKGHVVPYVLQAMNIVDFVAILPAYLGVIFEGSSGGGLAVLRILRMARILRMIKVGSYAENLALVAEGMKRSRTGLLLMVYLVSIFMIIMASLLYQIEGDPTTVDGSPGVFISIPHTFWCIIVTMTSVGYGDMYPTSDLGRIVTSFVMLTGILTLAVPITLIGNRFNDVWLENKQEKKKKEMMYKMLHGADDKAAKAQEMDNPISEDAEQDAQAQADQEAAMAEAQAKKVKTSVYVATVVLQDCLEVNKADEKAAKLFQSVSICPHMMCDRNRSRC